MPLTLPVKIGYYEAAHYSKGRTEPIKAIVSHRMVGYVAGTRSYFTNPETRPVSTHFGIGRINGSLVIDQYVPLDDTAYGNGNYDPSGVWDNWGYSTMNINDQTINIEHQDHGAPAGQGVVDDGIQAASIRLQALLLRGTGDEWRAAGIVLRDWNHNLRIVQQELSKLEPGPRTIITHNDIAGRLKPYCWKPWKYDKVGFPRQLFIDRINELIEGTEVPEDEMINFDTPQNEVGGTITTIRDTEAIPITGGERPRVAAGLKRPALGIFLLRDLVNPANGLKPRPAYMVLVGSQITFIGANDAKFEPWTAGATPDLQSIIDAKTATASAAALLLEATAKKLRA